MIVDADHLCVASRGIKDITSSTLSSFYGGSFEDVEKQKEFYTKISAEKDSLRKDSIKKNSVTKELLDTIKKARTS